jgi:hypothetical protein
VWTAIEGAAEEEKVFDNTIESAEVDNAVGVEWDQYLNEGLAKGGEQAFTIVNRAQVPSSLQISPANQTRTQGETETVSVKALDTGGLPYGGRTLRYTVAGGNAHSGAVTLNGAGEAQVSYVGNNAGEDTIQMYLDLPNASRQEPDDPTGSAKVAFQPKPVTPNSGYTVQSIHASSNGTVTIIVVPTQSGQATLEVTVPTGTIARQEADAAKRKRCKRGLVLIRRRCLRPTTLSGKLTAPGAAGVPLTLTVKPSRKLAAALKKRQTVRLTAKLSYRSSLGGIPVVQSFLFTVKPAKKKHRKR